MHAWKEEEREDRRCLTKRKEHKAKSTARADDCREEAASRADRKHWKGPPSRATNQTDRTTCLVEHSTNLLSGWRRAERRTRGCACGNRGWIAAAVGGGRGLRGQDQHRGASLKGLHACAGGRAGAAKTQTPLNQSSLLSALRSRGSVIAPPFLLNNLRDIRIGCFSSLSSPVDVVRALRDVCAGQGHPDRRARGGARHDGAGGGGEQAHACVPLAAAAQQKPCRGAGDPQQRRRLGGRVRVGPRQAPAPQAPLSRAPGTAKRTRARGFERLLQLHLRFVRTSDALVSLSRVFGPFCCTWGTFYCS